MRPGAAVMAAVRAAAAAVVAACLAAFAGWLILAPTGTIKQSEGIKTLQTSSLSGPTIFVILLTWCSLLLATLVVLAVRRMPGARAPPPAARNAGWVAKVRAWTRWGGAVPCAGSSACRTNAMVGL